METIEELLKKCRIVGPGDSWAYWDGEQWVVRSHPHRTRVSTVIGTFPSLQLALEQMMKETP